MCVFNPKIHWSELGTVSFLGVWGCWGIPNGTSEWFSLIGLGRVTCMTPTVWAVRTRVGLGLQLPIRSACVNPQINGSERCFTHQCVPNQSVSDFGSFFQPMGHMEHHTWAPPCRPRQVLQPSQRGARHSQALAERRRKDGGGRSPVPVCTLGGIMVENHPEERSVLRSFLEIRTVEGVH